LAVKEKLPPKPPEEPVRKTETRIDDLQIQIDKKQKEIDNVKKWVRGVTIAGGTIAGTLAGIKLRNPKATAAAGAITGMKIGDSTGDIAEKVLNMEVGRLEKQKQTLESKLKRK